MHRPPVNDTKRGRNWIRPPARVWLTKPLRDTSAGEAAHGIESLQIVELMRTD